jgi:pimeloyl-ACP methyl ester carboxylesterase
VTCAKALAAIFCAVAVTAQAACSKNPGSPAPTPPAPTRSATSGAASELPSELPVSPIAWRACGGGFQCGSVSVPQDYATAGGRVLSLAVSRRLAGKPSARAGVLVVDFGGPAISGAATLREAAALLPAGVLERFDVVSFDPRGSGESRPLRCAAAGPAAGRAGEAGLVSAAVGAPPVAAAGLPLPVAAVYQRLYSACHGVDPGLLATISSTVQARDLDRLRAALGVDQLHYLGFSYGSVLGFAYAQLFPDRLASMVLDSPIDPTEAIDTLAVQQAAAAEQALGGVPRTGPTAGVAQNFAALETRLLRSPLPAPGHGDNTPVSLGDLQLATLTYLQMPALTPQYPAALISALAGNGQALRTLAASQYEDVDGTPVIGAYWATICADTAERPSPITANTAAMAIADHYPMLGASSYAFAGGACTVWPKASQPVRLPKSGLRIAIVGGKADPIVPYAAAQGLAAKLAGSAFITRVGEGHTALGNASGDTCLANAETSFLLDPGSSPRRLICVDPLTG